VSLDKTSLARDLSKFEKISRLSLTDNKTRMDGWCIRRWRLCYRKASEDIIYLDSEIQATTRDELLVNYYLAGIYIRFTYTSILLVIIVGR
jgi:hypothetical protein